MATIEVTNAMVQDWIQLNLGAPNVEVELSLDQLDYAVQFALNFYSKWKPKKLRNNFRSNLGVTQHIVNPNNEVCYGVLDVEIFQRESLLPFLGPSNLVFNMYGYPYPMDIGNVVLTRMWLKLTSRVLGTEPDWYYQYDYNTQQGILWIYSPNAVTDVSYMALSNFTSINEVPQFDHYYVIEIALAKAIEILARTRGKHNPIMAASQTISLDAGALEALSAAKLAELTQSLKSTVADLAPCFG